MATASYFVMNGSNPNVLQMKDSARASNSVNLMGQSLTPLLSLHLSSFSWVFRAQKKELQPILSQYATLNGKNE